MNQRSPTQTKPSPSFTPVQTRLLQRKCACGNSSSLTGKCSECQKKKLSLQRRAVNNTAESSEVPPIVHEVLRSSGQPLDSGTRTFMESRFGHDFSQVRVHTDGKAAKSAQSVNALAYTVGQNVVFNSGQYAPEANEGQRLLAHELTHVIQQQRGSSSLQTDLKIHSAHDAYEREADRTAHLVADHHAKVTSNLTTNVVSLQRACGSAAIGEPTGCTPSSEEVERPRYLFRVNCDEFARGNEEDLRADAQAIADGEIIEIHGLASVDGDPVFNQHLSCARALRAKAVIEEILAQRGIRATIHVFSHGATPGDATQQRSVVVTRTRPTPPPEPDTCGPDATDWFIRQVNTAKTDRRVLALRQRLTGAQRNARRFGFSAERIAEGAVARRVLAEEARVGSPSRTPEARSQLTASVPGQREFGRALVAASVPLVGAPEAFVLAAIRGAALTWKDLVGTGRKYDFKNDSRTMQNPTSAHCPVNCANTITLCPTHASNCFIKDVPGNLFYAHVGRFVGWTELALQLGSQFAQLDASARWDPPEDTPMIRFGFRLPDPLTRSGLCAAINANRSIFNIQQCTNCSEETTAEVV